MNSREARASGGLYQNPLWARIESWAKSHPDTPCLKETSGSSLSYRELAEGVDEAARAFAARGFTKGDRALFLARPTRASVMHLLAILRAGGVAVVADPAMGREAFKSRIRLARPAWMILEPLLYWIQFFPFLEGALRSFGAAIPDTGRPSGVQKIRVRELRRTAPVSLSESGALAEDDEALVVFTSGTTSLPKGVVHTYRSILATLDLIQSDLSVAQGDVFYASQSYFLLMAFLSGATAILPPAGAFNPESFLAHLESFKATDAFLLPAEAEEVIARCRARGKKLPSTLKTLMLGSAPVLKGFLARLKSVLSERTQALCIYGATEIIPIARIGMEEKLAFDREGDILGTPFSGVRVRIEEGEIVAAGPNLAHAYLEGERLTEYATGDLGAIDRDGRLILLGRKKDMIIKGNYNIYPTLFESVISSIPGVKRCAMIGIYRESQSDEEIVLVIEPESSDAEERLRAHVAQELTSGPYSIDSYAQPDRIVYRDIPLSGRSRKTDKGALKELLA